MTTNKTLFSQPFPGTAGAAAPSQAENNSNGRSTRPEAQLYLNIGVQMEVPDLDAEPDADGVYPTKVEDLNIPLGVALDTQEPRKMGTGKDIRGKVWNQKVQVMNAVLQHLIDTGFSMEPGEAQQVTHIGDLPVSLTLRRRGDQAERMPDPTENGLLKQLGSLSIVK